MDENYGNFYSSFEIVFKNNVVEIPSFRLQNLVTFQDTTKASMIGRYLQKNTNCLQYLQYFVNQRAQHMLRNLRLINDQMRGFVQQKSRTQFIKTAFKKATGRNNERQCKSTLF